MTAAVERDADKKEKVEYLLFDMDGLLIDSERIYTDVTNEILGKYGKEMTWDIKAGCMGKPELEAAKHLLSFFPDIGLSMEDYLAERNKLQDLSWTSIPLLPGVRRLIYHLKKHNIPMAVATSSRRAKYNMKSGHLQDVFGLFDGKVVCSDDALVLGNGEKMRAKPEPDIFLVAAGKVLGRDVGEPRGELSETQREERARGLVFEDALPGMQAGKRAGMKVIWIPDVNLLDVEYKGDEKADQVLRSLEDFKPEEWGLPPYDEN
ncbi:HAD-like domain-containing protein [Cyathus striatus]|nr:HAD-like domain-containing protein [Cyathus striatus]